VCSKVLKWILEYELVRMTRSRRRNTRNSISNVRTTLEYLATKPPLPIQKQIISTARSPILRAVSDVALNALRGDAGRNAFSPVQRRQLARHKKELRTLAGRGISLEAKRRVLVGRGLPLVPIILGGLLGTLGERLFRKITKA